MVTVQRLPEEPLLFQLSHPGACLGCYHRRVISHHCHCDVTFREPVHYQPKYATWSSTPYQSSTRTTYTITTLTTSLSSSPSTDSLSPEPANPIRTITTHSPPEWDAQTQNLWPPNPCPRTDNLPKPSQFRTRTILLTSPLIVKQIFWIPRLCSVCEEFADHFRDHFRGNIDDIRSSHF